MKILLKLLILIALAGPAVAAPAADASTAGAYPNQGKVLDTMDASIYTYIQVTTSQEPVWLATTRIHVARGDTVSYPGNGVVMNNFASKSLNRKFDKIIFVDKITVHGK